MVQKKKCAKKCAKKKCSAKNCGSKKVVQETCVTQDSVSIVINKPSYLRIFWTKLKGILGL